MNSLVVLSLCRMWLPVTRRKINQLSVSIFISKTYTIITNTNLAPFCKKQQTASARQSKSASFKSVVQSGGWWSCLWDSRVTLRVLLLWRAARRYFCQASMAKL